MRISFTLDDNLDANLIAKILDRAGAFTKRHQAAKQMLQELSFADDALKVSNQYQSDSNSVSNEVNSGELDFSDLDDILNNS